MLRLGNDFYTGMKCNQRNLVAFFLFKPKTIMNKILSLEIFGLMLFESDAETWIKLCKEQKREWILKNTAQKDENLIAEFINNPNISKECKCLDCGKNKKDGDNISIGVSKKATATSKLVDSTKSSIGNRAKRQTGTKKRKD